MRPTHRNKRGEKMRIAIISDIHGNMQALEAVLADIKKGNCEKIFCLGDLAMAGPEPIKAIETIKTLQEEGKLEVIQGNTDEMIGNFSDEILQRVRKHAPIMANALVNDVQIIPEELRQYLKDLAPQMDLEIEGVKVLLVHGSPRKNDENIMPDMPIDKIEEIVADVNSDLIFCGHTHLPCGYQTSKKQTIVNDGSVGRPFTPEPKACYVVADFKDKSFQIQHKFVEYDRDTASQILAKRDFEGAGKLAQHLTRPESRHL